MNDVTINVMAVGDPAVYVYKNPEFKIIEKFEKDTGYTVNFNIIPWNEYYAKLTEKFDSKDECDVIMVAGHLWLSDFVKKGYLAPICPDRIDEDDDVLRCVNSEMYYEGKRYLYPSFCDGHMLVYRKSMLNDKVVDKINKMTRVNFDELEKICEEYSSNAKHAICLKAHPSEIYLDTLPYMRQLGADDDFQDEKNAVLGLERYMRMMKYAPKECVNFGNEEVMDAIIDNKVPMAVTWGGQLGLLNARINGKKSDLDYKAVAAGFNVTWSFAVTKTGDRPEVHKLLKYLTTGEVDKIVGAFAGSPVRYSTYSEDNVQYAWYCEHLNFINNEASVLQKPEGCAQRIGAYSNLLTEMVNEERTPLETVRECAKYLK